MKPEKCRAGRRCGAAKRRRNSGARSGAEEETAPEGTEQGGPERAAGKPDNYRIFIFFARKLQKFAVKTKNPEKSTKI